MLLMACHGAIALLCLLLGAHFLLTPARRRAPLQLLGFIFSGAWRRQFATSWRHVAGSGKLVILAFLTT